MFIANLRLKSFIQKFLCQFRESFDFAGHHPVRELQRRAVMEAADYVSQHMPTAIGVYSAAEALDMALKEVAVDGHYLEFGVFKGGTIRLIAKRVPGKTVHGFDSFEGLPDRWTGATMDKGMFAMGGKLPTVPRNVELHKGWFDATLPPWLATHPGPIAFAHIDCDIYASAKSIFEAIGPHLVVGTVIAFDEYFGYPNWRQHEFKAFQECVARHKLTYEYLVFARIQVGLKITGVGDGARRLDQRSSID